MKDMIQQYLKSLIGTVEFDYAFCDSDIVDVEVISAETKGNYCQVSYDNIMHSGETQSYNNPILVDIWEVLSFVHKQTIRT